MWNTIAIIVSGIILTFLIYIQKPVDAGITGAFLGAAGTDESFVDTKDIGIDKVIRRLTWIMFILFMFFFTMHYWV